jgi:hypothetical protein
VIKDALNFLRSFDKADKRRAARQNALESPATDVQQLQAKIRAIVIETVEAQNCGVSAGELLTDLVADLRVLSAM